VIDTAIDLAESQGLGAVSLRAVAARLGVTPKALYRHVEGSDELLDRVGVEMLERWRPQGEWPPESDWEATLLFFGRAHRAMLLEHPVMLNAVQRQSFFTYRGNIYAERVLAGLSAAGLDDEAAFDAWVTLHAFIYGYVAVQHARSTRAVSDERIHADRDQFREALESAPDDFPTLLRMGDEFIWGFTDRRFERSLRRLIAALVGQRARDR
jgi:AcrR family transcriptional regulator